MRALETGGRGLADARRFCRELTRQAAKNFYYAFLFLSKDDREAAFAIYSFCRVADDLADDETRPLDRRLADLLDYQAALSDCLAGRPVSHPVFVALRSVLDTRPIPDCGFKLMLEGVRQDLCIRHYGTFGDLEDYCYKVASTVAMLLLPLFNPARPGDAQAYVRAGGVAVQLTNIIRDVKEDAARGRVYLPQEDLARFSLSAEDILVQEPRERLKELLAFEAERAERLYEEADRLVTARDQRRQVVLETSRALYRRLLRRIRERGFDVFSDRISLSSREKLAIALGVRARALLAG